MSEVITPPEGTPPVETPPVPPVEEGAGGLPSANEPPQQTPWERAKADGYLPADAVEDPYELAKSLKNAQKYVQETNAEKARNGKADADAVALAATQETQRAEILEMVPKFIENGMQLTDEMITKASELGISESDIKVGAYEYRDNINQAYDLVGGQEAYAEMMTGMDEIMSVEDKKAFNADLGGSASKYAIKGLQAEWEAVKAGGQPSTPAARLEGKVPGGGSGAKPYANQKEITKDAGYLRTAKGRTDIAARTQYDKRMAATPDNIVYGR